MVAAALIGWKGAEWIGMFGATILGPMIVTAILSLADIIHSRPPAEAILAEGARFDVVLALEIVEHVADPQAFVATCARLLRPGGLLIASTLNRTPQSFAAAIVGAEWIMRWLPRGTHEWSRFIRPDELAGMFEAAGVGVVDRSGMVFNPLGWSWSLSKRDLSVNYLVTGVRQ